MSKAQVSALLAGLALAAALGACSRQPKIVVAPATAEESSLCAQKAAAAYGAGVPNVSLGAMETDPTEDYDYALPGAAQNAAGQGTQFLCRFNADREIVDVVTYIPAR